LHAGVNAGQNHRLVVSLGRKREVWSERQGRTTYRHGPHKVPAIEFAIQKTAATRAGSLTSNHLQFCHCPSLGGDLTQIALCASASFTLILYVRSRQKCVALLRRTLKRRYADLAIAFCGLISERRFSYWLAQTMCARSRAPRAFGACTRHARVDGAQLDRICRAPLELLHHYLARRGLEHHAVVAADGHGGQDRMSDGNLVRLWEL